MKNINIVRFKFIEAMVLEYGEVKRCHIMRCFNIAEAAASRTTTAYINASGNYIVKGKPCPQFKICYLDIKPNEFLAAAQIMANEQILQYKKVLI